MSARAAAVAAPSLMRVVRRTASAAAAAGLWLVVTPSAVTAQAAPLPTWDQALATTDLIRPVGRLIWTNLGYAPCPAALALPDSVTLVGRAGGAADSIGAVAMLDAESSEQWHGVSLPRDAAWRRPLRVVGARCANGRAAQLIVQDGTRFAVVFAEHPEALGATGFLRAAPSRGTAPLAWSATPAGTTLR